MRLLKPMKRLIAEFFGFAWENKACWIVPTMFMMLMLMFLVVGGSSIAPYIYTLF